MSQEPNGQEGGLLQGCPVFAQAPQNETLQKTIDKLVEYGMRNGEQFVKMMAVKQKDNPLYSFLFGGEGSAYYRWRLYCANLGKVASQQASEAAPATTTTLEEAQQLLALDREASDGLDQVLLNLNGTKDVIKSSQEWVYGCVNAVHTRCAGIVYRLYSTMKARAAHEAKQAILYLANDLVYKCLKPVNDTEHERQTCTLILECLTVVAPSLLQAVLYAAPNVEEERVRLQRIVQFWSSYGCFSPDVCNFFLTYLSPDSPPNAEAIGADTLQLQLAQKVRNHSTAQPTMEVPPSVDMTVGGGLPQQPPAQVQVPPVHPAQQGLPVQQGGPQQIVPGQTGGLAQQQQPSGAPVIVGADTYNVNSLQANRSSERPGYSLSAVPPPMTISTPYANQSAPGAANQTAAAPAAPQAAPQHKPPKFFPMSFAPGIIPGIVKHKLDVGVPYEAMTEREVTKASAESKEVEIDAYLRSHLAKFYAEIDEYRPGLTRAAYQATISGGVIAPMVDVDRSARDKYEVDEVTGTRRDGSFAGVGGKRGRGGSHLGLGASSASRTKMDDPFESFRKRRSSTYHQFMATRGRERVRERR